MSSMADWLIETFSQLGVGARSFAMLLTAVVDSSLVSVPEVNDALLFYLSAVSPGNAHYFVLAATGGSLVGCLLLNRIAHWKSPELIARLAPGGHASRGIRLYQRYGAWTLVVPALLPPPCPFKIFVVSSGALGLDVSRFVIAIAIGRTVRYSIAAVLAIHYGERALELLHAHGPLIVGIVAVAFILVLAFAVTRLLSRRSRISESPGAPQNSLLQEES